MLKYKKLFTLAITSLILLSCFVFIDLNVYATTPVTWDSTKKGYEITLSNGNMTASFTGSGDPAHFGSVLATASRNSGKWYWEIAINTVLSQGAPAVGIAYSTFTDYSGYYLGHSTTSTTIIYDFVANKLNSGNAAEVYGSTYGAGDVVGVALDLDNHTITFYKNGVSQGVAYTNLPSGNVYPAITDIYQTGGSNKDVMTAHFTQSSFQYSIPSGYQAFDDSDQLPSPTNLTAAAGNAQVGLSWTAVTGAASYKIKRSTSSGGTYATITSSVTGTTYTDATVTNGTTYYYVVTAVNGSIESGNSNEAAATPQAPAPDAPANLSATAGNGQIDLSWTAVIGAASYNVKRATVSGGPYDTVQSSVMTSVYLDETVTNGTVYFYVVSAVNAYGGESANSAQVSATPQELILNAPTGLTAAAGNAQVRLTWNAVTNATGYNIKRTTTQNGQYNHIAANIIGTSFIDPSAANGTTYYYVVSAVNDDIESGNSNEVSAIPQPPVANYAILKLTMTNGSEKEYDLPISITNSFITWYDAKSNGTGPACFVINKNYILGPFASRKEYISFDKIYCFEIEEYIK